MAIRINLIDPVTGEARRPELKVQLRRDRGGWSVPLPMMVDSGSDLCVVPVEWVAEYGLAMNLMEKTVRTFRTSSGSLALMVRGNLQLKIGNEEHSWPCLFSLPPDVDEANADEVLESILLQQLTWRSRPANTARPRGVPLSFGAWMKTQFPDLRERPALLGRRGFLETFELRLNQESMVIVRRSRARSGLQWMTDRVVWFLRME